MSIRSFCCRKLYALLTTCVAGIITLAFSSTPSLRADTINVSKQTTGSSKLRIGVYNDDPFFSYLDPKTGKLDGFNIEMARAIGKEVTGGENNVEFVVIDERNRIEALRQGSVDFVIAELSNNDKRKNMVDFSDIYYVSGLSILVNADSPFNTLRDLQGQTIGILGVAAHVDEAKKVLPLSQFMYFPSITAGFKALSHSDIQAFCIEDVVLLALLSDPRGILLDYRFLVKDIAWENYGIAVSKRSQHLLKRINEALRTIKADGRWQQYYEKHIGTVAPVAHTLPSR